MSVITDEEIISTIADDLPCGVWVARAPGGEFVYANRAFAEIMGTGGLSGVAAGGYAAPYGIHARDGSLYPEQRMPFVRALVERARVVNDDIVIHRHDGGKVYVRAEASPVFHEGAISHVVIAFFDITREVQAERARAESEARLERAQRLELIGNLAGGIAHDFNNLLATVKTLASTLRLDEKDQERNEALALVLQAADSGVQLTRSLLGFARRGKNLATRVSVNEVVRSTAGLFARTLGPGITLEFDLAAETGEVVGDFSQLEQIVMNLVVNARDAMAGRGRLTLRTRDVVLEGASRAGPHVALEVADTGPGIPAGLRERIFEPYFTTKTTGPVIGAGLGLATVWGITETHAGTVEVDDTPGGGATMRVVLPAAPRAVRAPVAAPEPAPALVKGTGTILVVEDEAHLREAAARALGALGYSVAAVADGAEAVRVLQAEPKRFRAVLLDMLLPQSGGRETYLGLREIDPDVRVLLMSGFAQNEEAQKVIDLGARGFLPKPFTVEALGSALARAIG